MSALSPVNFYMIYQIFREQEQQTNKTFSFHNLNKRYMNQDKDKKIINSQMNKWISLRENIDNLLKIKYILKFFHQFLFFRNKQREKMIQREEEQSSLLERIGQTYETVMTRVEEITILRQELQQVENKNSIGKRELERLDEALREERSISIKYQQEMGRQKDMINTRDLDNRGFLARIESMESNEEQNQRKLASLNDAKEKREQEMSNVIQRINKEQSSISQYRVQIANLDKEIQFVETQNNKHQQTQAHLLKITEQEFIRSRDNSGLEADRRSMLLSREDEFNSLKYEIESLKQTNSKYVELQYELQTEIEALKRHMSLLNQQNYELSTELEKFIDTDETVRRTLNRKQKVEDIRHKVDEAITKSMVEVQARRSPERNARESPTRLAYSSYRSQY